MGGQPVAATLGDRRRVVVTLGAVLALQSADLATVGAAAPQLQRAMGIGKAEIGVLLAVTTIVGAAATLPAGMLVDRVRRVRLLGIGVALWGVASGVSGLAAGFVFLLVTRVGLGVVVAVAGPGVASLLGDYFPGRQRGRIYSYVLTGELVGTGFGFIASGALAALSWRASFLALVPPAIALAFFVLRLEEPPRRAHQRRLAHDSASDLSLLQAVRCVLSVPSNVVLIVSSALGYFFFAGVRGFGIEFARHQYHLAQATVTSLVPVIGAGMLAGVLLSGRIADRALERGHRTARVTVAAVMMLCASALFVPALLVSDVALAMPLLAVCGCALAGTNPPLDAARLDVMPPWLWGRAEGVRTVLQSGAQAAAPILFGVVSSDVFRDGHGLRDTFLLSLVPLGIGGLLLLVIGRRTYPRDARDVSTASPGRPVVGEPLGNAEAGRVEPWEEAAVGD